MATKKEYKILKGGGLQAFEYDPGKSVVNEAKHGIDFEVAQRLWDDPALVELPARCDDELRLLVVGRIDGTHWAAVVTPRGERLRLISVRRAREREVQAYESA